MARVPTAAEIDAMSEAELEDYLDSAAADPQDTDAPPSGEGPSWLTATGASRAYAWLLAVAGVIGIAACWELNAAAAMTDESIKTQTGLKLYFRQFDDC